MILAPDWLQAQQCVRELLANTQRYSNAPDQGADIRERAEQAPKLAREG